MVVQEHTLASGDEPIRDIERVDQSILDGDRHNRVAVPHLPADVVVTRDLHHDDVAEPRCSDAAFVGIAGRDHSKHQIRTRSMDACWRSPVNRIRCQDMMRHKQ